MAEEHCATRLTDRLIDILRETCCEIVITKTTSSAFDIEILRANYGRDESDNLVPNIQIPMRPRIQQCQYSHQNSRSSKT